MFNRLLLIAGSAFRFFGNGSFRHSQPAVIVGAQNALFPSLVLAIAANRAFLDFVHHPIAIRIRKGRGLLKFSQMIVPPRLALLPLNGWSQTAIAGRSQHGSFRFLYVGTNLLGVLDFLLHYLQLSI